MISDVKNFMADFKTSSNKNVMEANKSTEGCKMIMLMKMLIITLPS